MDDLAIADIFAGLGPIEIRRLFGGKGIYHRGVIVALKADAESAPLFAAEGCARWTYTGSRHGKPVAMPYWSVPDGALDDVDEMTRWARIAYEAGMRTAR